MFRSSFRPLLFALLVAAAGCGGGSTLARPTDEALAACAALVACDAFPDFTNCVQAAMDDPTVRARTGVPNFDPAQLGCSAAAADCERVHRCLNLGQPATPCVSSTSTCDGPVRRTCFAGYTTAVDCTAVGLGCLVDFQGVGQCALGTCSTATSRCDGTVVTDCINGIATRTDCSVDGLACGTTIGSTLCIGTGPQCDSRQSGHCDGTVAVNCTVLRESRFDCATLGLRCVASLGPAFCANGTECNSGSSCLPDGRLQYCYRGAYMTYDCAAAGYDGCRDGHCIR